jgi:Zn-finger nucleic acid-binding protein
LLEQIRKKWTSALHCLKCGRTLQSKTLGKTQLFACPEGHGAWIDGATLDSIPRS